MSRAEVGPVQPAVGVGAHQAHQGAREVALRAVLPVVRWRILRPVGMHTPEMPVLRAKINIR